VRRTRLRTLWYPRFSSRDASRQTPAAGARITLVLQGFFYRCFFLHIPPGRAACFLLHSEEIFNQKAKVNYLEARRPSVHLDLKREKIEIGPEN
jgi:hypothetical protein